MSEVFVDLQYRGLALGARVRLSRVDGAQGYLELPSPMPVGTEISLHADGHRILAQVTEIHEQIGGSDRAPGMLVAPVLDASAKLAWWRAVGGSSSVEPDAAEHGELDRLAHGSVPQPGPDEGIGDPDDEPEVVIEREASSPGGQLGASDPIDTATEMNTAVGTDVGSDLITNDAPDPPASAEDSSPRGRKRRRANRR